MKELYLVWLSYVSHKPIFIGRLFMHDNKYLFEYNEEGASQAQNEGCILPFDLNRRIHISSNLFSFFQNRIMSNKRENIKKYLEKLDLKKYDDFLLLEITKGKKLSDNFLLLTPNEYMNISNLYNEKKLIV